MRRTIDLASYFNHPTGNLLGLYAASFYLPSAISAYLGDGLAQRYGRKIAVALGTIVILAGSLINAFATSSGMWVAGTSCKSHLRRR